MYTHIGCSDFLRAGTKEHIHLPRPFSRLAHEFSWTPAPMLLPLARPANPQLSPSWASSLSSVFWHFFIDLETEVAVWPSLVTEMWIELTRVTCKWVLRKQSENQFFSPCHTNKEDGSKSCALQSLREWDGSKKALSQILHWTAHKNEKYVFVFKSRSAIWQCYMAFTRRLEPDVLRSQVVPLLYISTVLGTHQPRQKWDHFH